MHFVELLLFGFLVDVNLKPWQFIITSAHMVDSKESTLNEKSISWFWLIVQLNKIIVRITNDESKILKCFFCNTSLEQQQEQQNI